jgi:hypothetical protein
MIDQALSPLADSVTKVAIQLGILDKDGNAFPDPEEITDEYLKNISTKTRAFLVLCSSELEEYIEARCLEFLSQCVKAIGKTAHHNCLHALSIHFRNNIGSLLDGAGYFVDFYASDEQSRRFSKELKGRKNKGDSDPTSDPPVLNKKTLIGRLCNWYREEVVASNHGIGDQNLMNLLVPLGFSRNLVKEECASLCAALQSLAAARGEAAHRAAQSSGWPFKGLPTPLEQQLSLRDAWERWNSVLDSLHELENLLTIDP